jgi:transcriptional regulator with XRE-family HTH domain
MAQLDAEGISARIREARLEAGLTQEQLADLLHVHKKTVENYEHGSINYRALNHLSAIVGKPVEWLLHGEDATRPIPEDLQALRREVEHLQAAVDEILEILRPVAPEAGSTSP